jgi:hypothetical protein
MIRAAASDAVSAENSFDFSITPSDTRRGESFDEDSWLSF